MILNWNPLVILVIVSGLIGIIISLIIIFASASKKIQSSLYIKMGIFFMALAALFDGISNLLMNILIAQISGILSVPAVICFSIGINYTIKETYISIHLIIFSCLGALLCYSAFQPGAVEPIIEYGYLTLKWSGLFGLLTDIISIGTGILLFYWGLRTWKNAPFLIKKEAFIFFVGISIATILGSLTLTFREEYHFLSNVFFYLSWNLGIIIFIYAIVKEPKLFYILPFTVYRILVKDKEGFPLFDHDWSESNINEVMFTGFINAVQVMSEEVMKIGGLIDINLEKGMLILHESNFITVGLVTSKSSKLLRDALINFSNDFEQKFERKLKQKVKNKQEYESAYVLIEKYFSNFPFRLVKSKKDLLLLSGKCVKIPFELENKVKDIFINEKEYEAIIAEIAKTPVCVTEDFLKLYDDLMNEMDQLPGNSTKEIDDKKSNIV